MPKPHDLQAGTIARIYDAALDPAGWDELPAIFAEAGDGGSGVVAILHAGGGVDTVTSGQPEEAGRQYAEYYRHVNPLDPIIASVGPMVVCSNDALMPVLAYRQTEFYTDFARRFDSHHVTGTSVIPVARGVLGHVGIHRAGSRPFGERSRRGLQILLPHLQRALQVRLRLGPGSSDLGFAALQTLSIGCVICDSRGVVIFANAAAEEIDAAGDGITLSGGPSIAAMDPAATRRLAVLVADATHGGSGGSLLISGPNGQIAALVAPLPSRFATQPGHALITLRSTSAASHLSQHILAELFGLTPAEARLAIGLAEGRSLAVIGDAHAVSENTLRTQLAAVLRKTGTHNQRELVRLLGLLPPVARRN